MRKMTQADVTYIVRLLERWKRRPLFWSHVQRQISIDLLAGEKCWSRQSLHANGDIDDAWQRARARLEAERSGEGRGDNDAAPPEVARLQAELDDIKRKYQNLLIKHRQLVYNASMLPGGTRLLLDPLPDNTPVQKRSSGSKDFKRN